MVLVSQAGILAKMVVEGKTVEVVVGMVVVVRLVVVEGVVVVWKVVVVRLVVVVGTVVVVVKGVVVVRKVVVVVGSVDVVVLNVVGKLLCPTSPNPLQKMRLSSGDKGLMLSVFGTLLMLDNFGL